MSLVAVARTNRGRPGEPARQVVCHARQTRTCPEARRTSPAQVGANLFVASAILHPTSMLDRLCFTWTGLRSMDRPSVGVRCAAILRIDAHAPNPLFLVSPTAVNEKQPFRRTAMRCIDVTENRRDIAVAAVRSASGESLRRACRSARTADFRGRCSSQSGESACCRCAVR